MLKHACFQLLLIVSSHFIERTTAQAVGYVSYSSEEGLNLYPRYLYIFAIVDWKRRGLVSSVLA